MLATRAAKIRAALEYVKYRMPHENCAKVIAYYRAASHGPRDTAVARGHAARDLTACTCGANAVRELIQELGEL